MVAALPSMLLCAGLGTRLRPLTDRCAKALVPIGDRPALAHMLARVGGRGARVVVNAHHRAADVRAFAAAWTADLVLVSEEAELLGTAGGVARAAKLLGDGDVLVWNGDILADVDVDALVSAHGAEGRDAPDATLVVTGCRPVGEGNVGLDVEGRVVRLRKQTTREGEVSGADFLAVHVLGARLRERLPERGCLVGDVYLPALAAGAELASFRHDAGFTDIGSVAEYRAACFGWLAATGRDAYQAPSASVVEGVTLRQSVVGEGARVEGVGALVRCIVWPGARAVAPLEDAVVTG